MTRYRVRGAEYAILDNLPPDPDAIEVTRAELAALAAEGKLVRPFEIEVAGTPVLVDEQLVTRARTKVGSRGRLVGAGLGRPSGLTTITDDDQLREPIREMRRDRRRITQRTVATWSLFTVAEIRGYLRATHRTWADFLRSF